MNQSSTGLSENVAGALCYVLGWLSGLVFFLLEKDSSFVRFHAVQSMITFGVLAVAMIISPLLPVLGVPFGFLVGILTFGLWIVCIIKAAQGERWKVPFAGIEAEKHAGRMAP